MRVELASSYGFCFGVERAISEIVRILKNGRRVFTDGDIVHNRGVMERLFNMGLELIDLKNVRGKVDGVFAIRAHGIPPDEKREVYGRFEEVIDLTCPIVSKLFEKARRCAERGKKVVVFGKEGHAEMEALKGYVPDAIVTREPIALGYGSVCVLSQTTSPWNDFCRFVGELLRLNFGTKDLEILNTVCDVTVDREKETMRLSESCDLVVIVGGKHSANTEKLYRIASERTKSLWIESAEELGEDELEGVECVGVVSGTSTPAEDVREVVEKINMGGKGNGREERRAQHGGDPELGR